MIAPRVSALTPRRAASAGLGEITSSVPGRGVTWWTLLKPGTSLIWLSSVRAVVASKSALSLTSTVCNVLEFPLPLRPKPMRRSGMPSNTGPSPALNSCVVRARSCRSNTVTVPERRSPSTPPEPTRVNTLSTSGSVSSLRVSNALLLRMSCRVAPGGPSMVSWTIPLSSAGFSPAGSWAARNNEPTVSPRPIASERQRWARATSRVRRYQPSKGGRGWGLVAGLRK